MSFPHDGLTHLGAQASFDDSNIAAIGTKLDHSAHALSATKEPAWQISGLGTTAGVWSWVIQDFKPVPYRTNAQIGSGDLKAGDSYIFLQSVMKGDKLVHNIFFWLGKESTQDETGTAAYKTVELDEVLKGAATQHREVQSSESPAFLSLFHPTLLVSLGGHSSGFHHVSPFSSESLHLASPRFWEITITSGATGRHDAKVLEVKKEKDSIVEDCVFLLDTGDVVYQWNGGKSHPVEKAKAAELARNWVDGRDGKASLKVFDEGDQDAPFFLALGLEASELPLQFSSRAHTISTHPVSYSLPTIVPLPFTREQLQPTSILLIVPSSSKLPIFIWVGSEVDSKRKKTAFVDASEVKGLEGRTWHMIIQGSEGQEFWKALD